MDGIDVGQSETEMVKEYDKIAVHADTGKD
jgi:hypothetical protein